MWTIYIIYIHINTFAYIYYSNFSHIILSSSVFLIITFHPNYCKVFLPTFGKRKPGNNSSSAPVVFFYPLEVTGEPNVSPNFHPIFTQFFYPIWIDYMFRMFRFHRNLSTFAESLNAISEVQLEIYLSRVWRREIPPQNDLKMTFRVGKW